VLRLVRHAAVEHKEIKWNPHTEEWFCVVCGRTSDHSTEEDARVELEYFECHPSTPERNDPRKA
jgi:hypothetical protein